MNDSCIKKEFLFMIDHFKTIQVNEYINIDKFDKR